jgi:hypothetical protein
MSFELFNNKAPFSFSKFISNKNNKNSFIIFKVFDNIKSNEQYYFSHNSGKIEPITKDFVSQHLLKEKGVEFFKIKNELFLKQKLPDKINTQYTFNDFLTNKNKTTIIESDNSDTQNATVIEDNDLKNITANIIKNINDAAIAINTSYKELLRNEARFYIDVKTAYGFDIEDIDIDKFVKDEIYNTDIRTKMHTFILTNLMTKKKHMSSLVDIIMKLIISHILLSIAQKNVDKLRQKSDINNIVNNFVMQELKKAKELNERIKEDARREIAEIKEIHDKIIADLTADINNLDKQLLLSIGLNEATSNELKEKKNELEILKIHNTDTLLKNIDKLNNIITSINGNHNDNTVEKLLDLIEGQGQANIGDGNVRGNHENKNLNLNDISFFIKAHNTHIANKDNISFNDENSKLLIFLKNFEHILYKENNGIKEPNLNIIQFLNMYDSFKHNVESFIDNKLNTLLHNKATNKLKNLLFNDKNNSIIIDNFKNIFYNVMLNNFNKQSKYYKQIKKEIKEFFYEYYNNSNNNSNNNKNNININSELLLNNILYNFNEAFKPLFLNKKNINYLNIKHDFNELYELQKNIKGGDDNDNDDDNDNNNNNNNANKLFILLLIVINLIIFFVLIKILHYLIYNIDLKYISNTFYKDSCMNNI